MLVQKLCLQQRTCRLAVVVKQRNQVHFYERHQKCVSTLLSSVGNVRPPTCIDLCNSLGQSPFSWSAGKIKAVTLEEEQRLLRYYASKIQGICLALHFPDKVRATALTFLKRAYLSFSVLDHNPKNIMLACIYLAGKVGHILRQ